MCMFRIVLFFKRWIFVTAVKTKLLDLRVELFACTNVGPPQYGCDIWGDSSVAGDYLFFLQGSDGSLGFWNWSSVGHREAACVVVKKWHI
jgi:hypothetical protein